MPHAGLFFSTLCLLVKFSTLETDSGDPDPAANDRHVQVDVM
jgi:hypothetical protein